MTVPNDQTKIPQGRQGLGKYINNKKCFEIFINLFCKSQQVLPAQS